jgi:hypothetical protein
MNRIIIGILLFVTLGGYTCHKDDVHYNLTIKNQSSKAISVSLGDYFPDTTLRCPWGYFEIGVDQENKIFSKNGWESEFKDYNYLQIFVMDSVINKEFPCDTIKKHNKILKRYQLTLDDIKKKNWTITYP